MGIWSILTGTVAPNIAMSMDNVALLLLVLGSLIIMAKNFQIGMILLFLFSSGMFIIFYHYELNYTPFLVLVFMSIVMLILSIYASSRAAKEGTII